MIDVESMVFSRVYNDLPESLIEKYDLDSTHFSTESSVPKESTFPFVYVHLLPAVEIMNDLNNTSINGGLYTIQIDITDNEDSSKVKEIMDAVIDIMKASRFNITAMPEFQYDSSSIYRQTARFRRLIASGETL